MQPARILLVRLSHLGDVVHALPVHHSLRAAHPGAEIAWACQPEFGGLLEGLPGLARVIPFDRRGGLGAWLKLRRALLAYRPELVVDAQGNAKSAAAVLLAGRARRAGLHRSDWQEPLFARVLSDPAPPAPGPHAMDRMLGLASHLGAPLPARRDPGLSDGELEIGEARAAVLLGRSQLPPVLMHLGPRGDVRHWPPERFVALARALRAAGRAVCVLAGPAEERDARDITTLLEVLPNTLGGATCWTGAKPLRELAAFFAAAATRGARLVCGDTGPMHLAAAVDLPVVLLAGPRDPARTGPWPPPPPYGSSRDSSPHRVVALSDPPACMPCLSARCRHAEGRVCLDRLELDAVLGAALAD
jgi:ADP-heptose:LPS heptosyltransferase